MASNTYAVTLTRLYIVVNLLALKLNLVIFSTIRLILTLVCGCNMHFAL